MISTHTETRTEGYFRLEREWAARRAKKFAHGDPFYFPLVIDPTVQPPFRGEPPGVHEYHVEAAAGGRVSAAFVDRLLALQRRRAPHLVSDA